MKWIKHMTATRRDERVARLISKHGMAAYGLYWSIQEIIADQMEGSNPSCSVSYPVSMWSHQLSIYAPQVEKQLQWMADAGLMDVQRVGDELVVTNAKLLKYRDEYSRKSGHTPDKLPSKSGRDIEGEKEVDKAPKAAPPVSLFLVPDWVPSEPWLAWLKIRTKKRAVNTDYALGLAVRELEKLRACGEDPAAVLNQAIVRSYTGLFPVHANNSNGNGRGPTQQKVQILARPGVSRA